MKMYFVSGKFSEEKADGINRIDFIQGSSDMMLHNLMAEALNNVDVLLNCGEVIYLDNYENDIFVIHLPHQVGREEVIDMVKKVINSEMQDVINHEDVYLDAAVQKINMGSEVNTEDYCEETVFWDLLNQIIVVLGKKNLIKVIQAFEYESWRKLQQFSSEEVIRLMKRKGSSKLLRKML